MEHLHELRRRLTYIIAVVIVLSTAFYFVQEKLVYLLLRPSHGQQFIYTSPIGGINFLFSLCTYAAVGVSLPFIVYQILRFFEPVITDDLRRFIVYCSLASGGLAAFGIGYGYELGLPAALHFLKDQFTTSQIHPLFTIQEYMSFVCIYLIGSALLFQIPLILLCINRLRPIPPRSLWRGERYVVAGAFIIAMIMAPTPNIFDQLILAVPIILIYNIGALIIWRLSKRKPRVVVANEYWSEKIDQPALEQPVAKPLYSAPAVKPVSNRRPRLIQDVYFRYSSPT